jgi:nicotinate-nucleotide adenylyltransferase
VWLCYNLLRMKFGLFGGSFNPVTLGHLLVARAALEEQGLSRLCFIPAAQSPFKPGAEMAPAAQRLQLLRLALAGQTWCELDDQEIKRGGVSYTIDTLRDYARRFPGAELHWLIGADLVATLPQWRDANELARLVTFLVIPRPGEAPSVAPTGFTVKPLQGVPFAVSSSQVRTRVKAGQSIDWLVPPSVAEAIRNNRLYL